MGGWLLPEAESHFPILMGSLAFSILARKKGSMGQRLGVWTPPLGKCGLVGFRVHICKVYVTMQLWQGCLAIGYCM